MAETLKTFASLLRSLVTLVFLACLGIGGWLGYDTLNERSRLAAELEKAAGGNREADRPGRRPGKTDRTARSVAAAAEAGSPAGRDSRAGSMGLARRQKAADDQIRVRRSRRQLPADRQAARCSRSKETCVYVDAWVVKYLDRFVEKGDPVRGTSICLFKRLFGEYQEPSEGFVLDPVGSRPAAYSRGGEMPEFEREIWRQFWDFANDPEKAEQAGIRAAHGEAPFIKLRPGKAYLIKLRSSGGLSIKPKDAVRPSRAA